MLDDVRRRRRPLLSVAALVTAALMPAGAAVAAPAVPALASATTAGVPSSGPDAAPLAGRERHVRAKVTSFTPGDNSPPGRGISYPIVHRQAGGIGTWENPVTMATGWKIRNGKRRLDYTPGSRVYLPHIKRYGIFEDACHTCGKTPRGVATWVDVWVDGPRSCADTVEGYFTIVLNPKKGHPVARGNGVYSKGVCRGGGGPRW